MKVYDSIIIGAGVSGLCISSLLAKKGEKVLILEKAPVVGGRYQSINYKNHVLDDGAHMPSESGHMENVFKDLGLKYPELLKYNSGEAWVDGKWVPMKDYFPMSEAKGIFEWFASMPEDELLPLYDVSVKDWAKEKSDDISWEHLFTYTGQIADVGNKIEDLSMGEFAHFYREHLLKGYRLNQIGGTISGGLRSVSGQLQSFFEEHGGEIRLNTPVNDIVVKGGVVRGVEIETGEKVFPSHVLDTEIIEAKKVISTLPIWDFFKVISEDEFPAWYRDWIDRLKKKVTHVWTIAYAVDKPLWPMDMFRWTPKLKRSGCFGVFYQHQSYGDKAGEIQVNLVIQGNYDDLPDLTELQWAKNRREVRKILDGLEKDGIEQIPGLKDAAKWQVRTAGIFGLTESPAMTGMHRPTMTPPEVKNLYIVSDTIREAKGLGIQAIAHASEALIKKVFPND
ncbi:MAG: NAD(P)/FAD-dependent oxidoreductase [Desulfobacterales bacterium]|nr:NAD(P)/FAD-dependent oxidoreductase [Desulfobacterales bacterium]